MIDLAMVYICGVAGDNVKFMRAKNGKEMCTFTIIVDDHSKQYGDSDDYRKKYGTMIRIMVFDNRSTRCVDYLKRVGFHRGQRVFIFGRLQSYKKEYKGLNLVQNYVQVRDISLIRSKSEMDEIEMWRANNLMPEDIEDAFVESFTPEEVLDNNEIFDNK